MGPGISVAVVTFNGERFIRKQLESIVSQHPVPVTNAFAGFGQLGAAGMQGMGMIQQGQQHQALIEAINGLG